MRVVVVPGFDSGPAFDVLVVPFESWDQEEFLPRGPSELDSRLKEAVGSRVIPGVVPSEAAGGALGFIVIRRFTHACQSFSVKDALRAVFPAVDPVERNNARKSSGSVARLVCRALLGGVAFSWLLPAFTGDTGC